MAKRLPHTDSTKYLATAIARRERRVVREDLRVGREPELRQPRGRAIYDSH